MAGEETNPAAGGGAGDQAAADSADDVIGAFVATAKQLPGVVPELITGKTVKEVNASIDAAKAAYARVADQVKPAAAAGGGAAAPVVGTGSPAAAAGGSDEPMKFSSEGGYNKILAGIEKGKQTR